jgi:hypothetical protein
MRMPAYLPQVDRNATTGSVLACNSAAADGLTRQCDWYACISAISRCISHPDPKSCILDIAPNCATCL